LLTSKHLNETNSFFIPLRYPFELSFLSENLKQIYEIDAIFDSVMMTTFIIVVRISYDIVRRV